MTGLRVLVCGGRSYGSFASAPNGSLRQAEAFGERGIMCRALDEMKVRGMTMILHGAATGADAYAARWARDHDVATLSFPAAWKAHGRAAGPIRNQRMLDEGKPDLVIAFPGGRGTADMVRRALKAGVEVQEVQPA